MDFFHANFRVAFFGLMVAVVVSDVIQANRSDSEQNCKELLCPAPKNYESRCFMNDSTTTIELTEIKLEREHYGILVIYNQAWYCKASLMLSRVCVGQEERKLQDCRKMKAREVTSTKSCQMTLIHRPIPSREYGEERKDVSDKGFKISFKHRNCCNNQSDGVFIIRRRNGSFDARACLNFSRVAFTSKEENFVNNSRAKPTPKQRETTNQRETVRRDLMTYCLVVTCFLLEILAGVVLFGLWKIYWRGREVENTASNPTYQQGLQRPRISEPVTAQEPYQSLLVDIMRSGGSSAEYWRLEGGQRDDHRVGVPVDQTNYQGLVQANQGDKYQCLVADVTLKERECQRDERDYGEPKSEGTLKEADVKPSRIQPYYSTVVPAPARLFHSLRSLGQSTESRGCNTLSSSPNKHGPCNTGPFGQSTNEPLEGSEVTTEKAPGALTRNNYDDPIEIEDPIHYVTEGLETGTSALDGNSVEEPFYYELEEPLPVSELNRDAMYHVVKELERNINANGAKSGAPSSDSIVDPLYCVLEDPKSPSTRARFP